MQYTYCVGREGINSHFLYRGNPVYEEVFIQGENRWQDEDLVGIYDGDITTQTITAVAADLIVSGKITATEAYRNSKYWR